MRLGALTAQSAPYAFAPMTDAAFASAATTCSQSTFALLLRFIRLGVNKNGGGFHKTMHKPLLGIAKLLIKGMQ
jgi:hypothetical protein